MVGSKPGRRVSRCDHRVARVMVEEGGGSVGLWRPRAVVVAGVMALTCLTGVARGASLADSCGTLGVSSEAVQSVFGPGAAATLEVRIAPGPTASSGTSSTDYCLITASPKLQVLVNTYPASQASTVTVGYAAAGTTKQILSGLGTDATYLHETKPEPADFVLFQVGPDFVVLNGLAAADPVNSDDLVALAHSIYTNLSSVVTPATQPTTSGTAPAASTTSTSTSTSTTSASGPLNGRCPTPLLLANLDSFCTRQPTVLPPGHWKLIARKAEQGQRCCNGRRAC